MTQSHSLSPQTSQPSPELKHASDQNTTSISQSNTTQTKPTSIKEKSSSTLKKNATQDKTTKASEATKPPTKTQALILEYLYSYRFVNIGHIQSFLNHKDKRRIQSWLNDLLAKEYIHQDYKNRTFQDVGTPAVYYLATAGVRYLRKNLAILPEVELRNRYYDKTRTPAFIAHSLIMADVCVSFNEAITREKKYTWFLQSDYSLIDEGLLADYLQELKPHAYIEKEMNGEMSRYVIEHLHTRLPQARLRQRLKKLLEYAAYEWGFEDDPPTILILCDDLADLIYVKRRVRYLLRQHYEKSDLDIRVMTTATLRAEGVTGGVWEDIYIPEYTESEAEGEDEGYEDEEEE